MTTWTDRYPLVIPALAVALLLAGCAHRPGAGSYADVSTTGISLAQGSAELNPIIGWNPNPLVTVVTALGVKQGAKYTLDSLGHSPCQSNRLVETAGWFGAGWNLPVLLASSAVAWPYTLVTGGIAAYSYYQITTCTEGQNNDS